MLWLILMSDVPRQSDEATARLLAASLVAQGIAAEAVYAEAEAGTGWRWGICGRGLSEAQRQRMHAVRPSWVETSGFEFELPSNNMSAAQILHWARR